MPPPEGSTEARRETQGRRWNCTAGQFILVASQAAKSGQGTQRAVDVQWTPPAAPRTQVNRPRYAPDRMDRTLGSW